MKEGYTKETKRKTCKIAEKRIYPEIRNQINEVKQHNRYFKLKSDITNHDNVIQSKSNENK